MYEKQFFCLTINPVVFLLFFSFSIAFDVDVTFKQSKLGNLLFKGIYTPQMESHAGFTLKGLKNCFSVRLRREQLGNSCCSCFISNINQMGSQSFTSKL